MRRALGSPLAGHRELTDGMVNTAYRLTTADGRDRVLKVAPPPGTPLLTHERDLMRTEAMAFARMAEHGLPVPEVLLAEDDPLLMTARRDLPWSAARPADRERLRGDPGARPPPARHHRGPLRPPVRPKWTDVERGALGDDRHRPSTPSGQSR